MSTPRYTRRQTLGGAVRGGASLALGATGLGLFGPDREMGSAGTARAAEPVRTLRIGYQKSSTLLLAKLDGNLERRLAARGVRTEWGEFSSGPPLLSAIAVSALDVGEVGDAPGVFAQAAGAPVKYVAYAKASPASVGLLVRWDSPVKTVAELLGKRIGLAKGSSAHYFLIKALKEAGLSYRDITPVFLQPPEGRAAFDTGDIDAWAVWDPFFAAAELGSRARLLRDGRGLIPFYGFYLASDAFLASSSDLVAPLLEELEVLESRAKKDIGKTAATLARQLGIPLEVATRYETRKQRYGGKPLTPEIIASQQEIADLFLADGLISKPIAVKDYVWTRRADPRSKPEPQPK